MHVNVLLIYLFPVYALHNHAEDAQTHRIPNTLTAFFRVHSLDNPFLRVHETAIPAHRAPFFTIQGPRSRGSKGGSCPPPPPPTFLADNVNLFNALIIADAYTSTSISSGARRQPEFCYFVLVQCLTLVSYSDLIVCLTKETPKYFCLCFFDSQPIGFELLPDRSAT